MVHTTIEDHLDEICPRCGKEHQANWTLEIDSRIHYFKLTCADCHYVIFKKIDFITHDIEHIPQLEKQRP